MSFYDHFLSSKPTALGRGFAQKTAILMRDMILDQMPEASKLLEIGPGRGEFCLMWLRERGDVTVVEANSTIGEPLSKEGIQVVKAFAPPIPCEDNQFDVVLASHVIEHMPTVDQAIALAEEMTRVCRPGGVICIASPDIKAFGSDFWNVDYTHSFVTSPRRIEQLLGDSGLKVEKSILYSGYLTGIKGLIVQTFARFLPVGPKGGAQSGSSLQQKIYKLKVTFLGNFFVIGRKA